MDYRHVYDTVKQLVCEVAETYPDADTWSVVAVRDSMRIEKTLDLELAVRIKKVISQLADQISEASILAASCYAPDDLPYRAFRQREGCCALEVVVAMLLDLAEVEEMFIDFNDCEECSDSLLAMDILGEVGPATAIARLNAELGLVMRSIAPHVETPAAVTYFGDGVLRIGNRPRKLDWAQQEAVDFILDNNGAVSERQLKDARIDKRTLGRLREIEGLEPFVLLPAGKGKGGFALIFDDRRPKAATAT